MQEKTTYCVDTWAFESIEEFSLVLFWLKNLGRFGRFRTLTLLPPSGDYGCATFSAEPVRWNQSLRRRRHYVLIVLVKKSLCHYSKAAPVTLPYTCRSVI